MTAESATHAPTRRLRLVPAPTWGRAPRRAVVFLAPALILSGILYGYPAVSTLITSFTNSTGSGASRFVGGSNYAEAFTDPAFIQSLLNTVGFTAIYTVGTVGFGLLLALALFAKVPGHRVWRFVILLPAFLPVAYIGLVWQIGLDPSVGWVNAIIHAVSPTAPSFSLTSSGSSIVALAVISTLQGAGWPMAILWTSMQDVAPETLEASLIDGAGPFQRTRYIIVPAIREVLATVTVLQIIFGLKVFDIIWVMTQGGPNHATESMTSYVYNQAFVSSQFGYGCAIAVITCVLVALIMAVYFRLTRERKDATHA